MKRIAILPLLLLPYAFHLSAQEASDLQRLRSSYDSSVQRAVRPLEQSYLQALGRLRATYASAGRQADVQQVDAEIKLVNEKLAAMEGAAPSAVGHRTVVLDSQVTIPANSPGGYKIGPIRQGDVITLQYASGLWKAHGHIPTENPDALGLEHGDDSRLAIARGSVQGRPGEIITIVPPETTQKPFSFTFPTTREEVVLRINKNSEDEKNPGSIVYQVKILR